MNPITKITIKGCSGYGPGNMAYEEKFSITPNGMTYEYKPLMESEYNSTRKWSYKTNSPLFKITFEKVADLMPAILAADETFYCTDVGMVDFTITYADKSKKHICYWGTPDRVSDCFKIIRDLIPGGELIPEVLRSCEEDLETD